MEASSSSSSNKTPELVTGAASGADTIFNICAVEAGHDVLNIMYKNQWMRKSTPLHELIDKKKVTTRHLTEPERIKVVETIMPGVAVSLGRLSDIFLEPKKKEKETYKRNTNITSPLPRSIWNGHIVDSLYAVGMFENQELGTISGGTAWAMRAFYLRQTKLCPQYQTRLEEQQQQQLNSSLYPAPSSGGWCGRMLDLYFSSRTNYNPEQWYRAECGCQYASTKTLSGLSNNFGMYNWRVVEFESVPVPSGVYGGVGSRDLKDDRAVRALYRLQK